MVNEFHYLLMSQKDFLENQVIEEILRERANFYLSQKKKKDFWILTQPTFILNKNFQEKILKSNFYQQQKQNLKSSLTEDEFFVSLVSINKEFITWVALRLGFFENIETLEVDKKEIYTSNGIIGKIEKNQFKKILNYSSDILHPDLLINKYQQSIKYFYSTEQKTN